MDFEKYDKIHTVLESNMIDRQMIDECLQIFKEDALSAFDMIELFPKFFNKVLGQILDKEFDTLDDINTVYIEFCKQNSILSDLYYIKIYYYFYSGFYAKAVEHIFKFDELNSSTDTQTITANLFMVQILLHDNNNIPKATRYMEKVFNNFGFETIPATIRMFACSLGIRLSVMLNQIDNVKRYQILLKNVIDDVDPETSGVYLNYREFINMYVNCYLYNNNPNSGLSIIHLANQYQDLFDAILNGKKFINDSVEINLYIIKSISEILSKEQIIYYCRQILHKWNCNAIETISIYGYLFDNFQINERDDHIVLMKEYIKALDYNNQRGNALRNRAIVHELESYAEQKEYREIQKEYTQDFLTNCYNRVYLNKRSEEFDFFRGYVIFFDLDKLKRINDTLGHHNGDTYIVSFANSIKEAFGPIAEIFRVGGDEFVLLYPSLDKSALEIALKRLISFCELTFELECGPVKGRFSAGIVAVRTNESLNNVISRADATMYRAKRNKDVWYYYENETR